jgi:hypothetical protein
MPDVSDVPVTFDLDDRRQRRDDGRWLVRVRLVTPDWDTDVCGAARSLGWDATLLQRLCREGCVPALFVRARQEWRLRSVDLSRLATGDGLVPWCAPGPGTRARLRLVDGHVVEFRFDRRTQTKRRRATTLSA